MRQELRAPALDVERPRTRGECRDGVRPCPWVGCRHALFLEVTAAGGLKLNFPTLEPWQIAESCSLDAADRGGMTLEDVGLLTNLTRERIRQVEVGAFASIRLPLREAA